MERKAEGVKTRGLFSLALLSFSRIFANWVEVGDVKSGYSQTLIIWTLIIWIFWLSWLFLWSHFCREYLLVLIKIHSHILLKTIALKSEVKASLFHFQKAKAALICIVTYEEHPRSNWLRVALLLCEASHSLSLFSMLCKINKLHSVTNVCSSLTFIFLIIQTLDYPDYFIRSQ